MDELEVFEKNVRAIFDDMAELLISKRRSYGPSNLDDWGGLGCLIMGQSKLARLKTMYKGGAKFNDDGDSMFDAWRDLIGYAVLAIIYEMDEAVGRRIERIENPLPGESYFKIERPEVTPGPFSIEEWNPPSVETFDMTGFSGGVAFGGDSEVEVNGVPMTTQQFTAVLKGMNKEANSVTVDLPDTDAARAMAGGEYVREPETEKYPIPSVGSSILMYQCLNCGRIALNMDQIPYDCHPFVQSFVTEVSAWEAL